jgi:hypothetical protein
MSPTPAAPPPVSAASPGSDGLVDAFGGRYYRIADVHTLPVFFMNIVSASDLWLFAASNGGLTAGRGDPDGALFPYRPVDQVYDSAGLTGPATLVRVMTDGGEVLWEPFAAHTPQIHRVTRHLYKSVEGDRVWFEEVNESLGLVLRYGWSTAEEHGFIRRCELVNLGPAPRGIRLVDALRNLLPPGVPQRLQQTSSCLSDAYKAAEVLPDSTLAVYALAAAIVDRAIPMESLLASTVWSAGLPGARVLLTDRQIDAFRRGEEPDATPGARGLRATYGVASRFTLAARDTQAWTMVADVGVTQAEVVARHAALREGTLPGRAERDAAAATALLRGIVGSADGLQAGGEETTAAHHFANVLFNVMRGGVFADAALVPAEDFRAFVRLHHRGVAARHDGFLRDLPARLPRAELVRLVAARADADLSRLAGEYLPLTFSRRHGDPSRPWNRFRIRVRDAAGRRVFAHEGNWRDIFQNWEALCLGYPEYFDAVVAKFLSASTPDGYNPYRISHAGVDWEVPDHEDPWSSIGYWGDHQVVYLQKLLEWAERYHPGRLKQALRTARYSYANVPYRLAPYADTCRNPRETITFAAELHREIVAREAREGSDARLCHDGRGAVVHVNLTEKLLVLVLTRLTNFVAGGGIWMNTQRPEWNDANNALVGYGISAVTLCYLRRTLAHLRRELVPALGTEPVPVSAPVVGLLRQVQAAWTAHRAILAAPDADDAQRRSLLDALGAAGSDYRAAVYRDGPGAPVALAPEEIRAAVDTALEFVDHTLRAGRREDGLYHSYNRLEFTEHPPGLRVLPLHAMLEGQVAVLSSGALSAAESLALLEALRRSPLYRADQHSYVLYPDRALPGFLARGTVAAEGVAANPLLAALLAAGDRSLVERDAAGAHRFASGLVNADALQARLDALASDPRWSELVAAHSAAVHGLYEATFHHRAFTGRSGSMFGYEGLGCIYWHMVAKLLLAVQETQLAAAADGAPEAAALARCYYDIRAGLGFNKSPAVYGAFPTDPYSHTPGHSGAQQPGMTGQVKEEILTRFGELGVLVHGGRVEFRPTLLRATEFTRGKTPFRYVRAAGEEAVLELPAEALGFTFCGVPVVYRRSDGGASLRWRWTDGSWGAAPGRTLPAAISAHLFGRDGRIDVIEVDLGSDYQPLPA